MEAARETGVSGYEVEDGVCLQEGCGWASGLQLGWMGGSSREGRPYYNCMLCFQVAEEEEDSGAPPLKRFCGDQPAAPQTASES